MGIKKTMGIGYLLVGIVWAVIMLPNVLNKTNNSSFMASLLTVGRVLGWPIFIGMYLLKKKNGITGEIDETPEVDEDED